MGLSERTSAPTSPGNVEAGDEITPHEAADRWIDVQRTDHAEASITSLNYRLKRFVEFCEDNEIERMGGLSVWDIDGFTVERRGEVNKVSLNNQLGTLENWLEWCETRGLVDEKVVEAVDPPTVPKAEKSSDVKLSPEDGIPQLKWFRAGDQYGSRRHAVLELMWHVGCRLGAIRALDLRDFVVDHELGEYYLDFRHRPGSDTPLKNQKQGERPVTLREPVAQVVETYIDENRIRIRDQHGREPLFTTDQGRISTNTVRTDCYAATAPCWRTHCPHDRPEQACEFWERGHRSRCPSTRSPHQVRTGSVSWQLDQGVPLEVVAKRVNASTEIIKEHYDKSDPIEEMRKRRQPHLHRLDIEGEIEGGESWD